MCAQRAGATPRRDPWYRPEGFITGFCALMITAVVTRYLIVGEFGDALGIIGPLAALMGASGGAGVARVVFERRQGRRDEQDDAADRSLSHRATGPPPSAE